MKQKAIVDRFEGDFVVLERDDGTCINIPRANAPGNGRGRDGCVV